MPSEHGHKHRELEQDRLIHAIESAMDVSRPEQFHAWMRGPLRALLPHDNVAYMKLDEHGGASEITCLHHKLVDAEAMEMVGHPEHGLFVRLAREYRTNRRQCCPVDGDGLKALLDACLGAMPNQVHNAIVHRVRFLSGETYCVVMMNVAAAQFERSRQLFRLLSSHLKMALARSLAGRDFPPATELRQREIEILQWMRAGKSNREISNLLGISPLTLKDRVNKLYRKLNVQNRADAVSRGLPAPNSSPLSA